MKSRRRQRKRRWLIPAGLAVVVLIIVGVVLISGGSGSDTAARDDLEAQFWASYLADAPGGGSVSEVELTAAPATTEVIDGAATEVWAYNGVVPGEEMRISLGDTLRVTLQNSLPVATTLHFHGIGIPNHMDGFPGVTQDAIGPGETFVYEFTPREAGTYYYHPSTNSTEQLERGLYGVLVVEDPVSAQYSQDLVWVIDDWSLTESGQIDPLFNAPTDVTHNGRWADLVTVNGSTNEELRARPGERLRIRFVNASVARVYGLRFGDLPAQLIAVDSLYVRTPTSADATLISAGDRVDVDIVVPDEPGRYEILDDWGVATRLGTIVVEGDAVATPDFAVPSNPMVPVWAEFDEVGVDIEYKFALQGGQWTINGKAYPDPDVQEIESEQFTRIRFTNNSMRLHPMHLHGQTFKVLEVDGEPVDEGFFRDSVLVFPDQVVDVGLVAVDEGTWVLQCHIMEHTAAGMVSLVDVTAQP